jgi:hypothetical protein
MPVSLVAWAWPTYLTLNAGPRFCIIVHWHVCMTSICHIFICKLVCNKLWNTTWIMIRVAMHLTRLPLDTMKHAFSKRWLLTYISLMIELMIHLSYFNFEKNDRLGLPTHHKSGCLILTMNQDSIWLTVQANIYKTCLALHLVTIHV